jgi:hypothetical protein
MKTKQNRKENEMKKITKDMIMVWLGSTTWNETNGYLSNQETENTAYDVIWELFSGGARLGQYQEDVIDTWEELKGRKM